MIDNAEILNKIEKKIESTNNRFGNRIPYLTGEQGIYSSDMSEENLAWWTNGFYAGIMWQMYMLTAKSEYKNTAEFIEKKFDSLLQEGIEELDHDIGFLWLHTSIANYRITKNKYSKKRGIHAANMLAARFNANGNYIVAWNNNDSHMIIDSLMNLPLLFWASEETSDHRFESIAKKHLETALNYIQRSDGSCNHICVFDSVTGEFREAIGGQGYATGSSWTRGQSWAIYGFTLAYEYTGDKRFLVAAQKAANYVVCNLVQYDFVTPIDFRAPLQPLVLDTTAAAITASGLIELANYVCEAEAENLRTVAKKIITKLVSDYCDFDLNTDGVLDKGSAKYHNDKIAPEQKIIYGDYFLIEAILKLQNLQIRMW